MIGGTVDDWLRRINVSFLQVKVFPLLSLVTKLVMLLTVEFKKHAMLF
jgi:hypothetical protein